MARASNYLLKVGISLIALFLITSGTVFGADKIDDEYAPNRVLVKFKAASPYAM